MNILEKYSLEISVTSFWVTFLFLGPFLIATNNLSVLMETGVINWCIAFLVSLVVSYIVIKVSKKTKIERYIASFFSGALMVAWLLNLNLVNNVILYANNSLIDKFLRAAVIILPAFGMMFFFHKKNHFAYFFTFMIMFMQLVGTMSNIYNTSLNIVSQNENKFAYDKGKWEKFAKEQNIVVFIVDTFGSQFTAEAIENDEVSSILKDFTYYPDYLATANRTKTAIPLLFSGKYDDWFNLKMKNNSVVNLLKDNGFGVDVLTFSSKEFFEDTPDNSNYIESEDFDDDNKFLGIYLGYFSKFTFGNLKAELEMRQGMFNAFADKDLLDLNIKKAINKNKALKIMHIWGIHVPVVFDEKGKSTTFYQRITEEHLQTKRTLGIFSSIGLFLGDLKKQNIYDSTAVIIIGDHGVTDSVLNTKNKQFDKTNIEFDKFNSLMFRANATLLIKPMNSRNEGLVIDYKKVSGFDIAKTIANIAKIKNEFVGYDVLKSQEIPEDRVRDFYYYKLNANLPEKKYSVSGSVGDASGWKLEEEF